MRIFFRSLRNRLPNLSLPIDLGDLQLIAGLGSLTYGVSLLSVPMAWITVGGLLLAGWIAPRLPRAKKG